MKRAIFINNSEPRAAPGNAAQDVPRKREEPRIDHTRFAIGALQAEARVARHDRVRRRDEEPRAEDERDPVARAPRRDVILDGARYELAVGFEAQTQAEAAVAADHRVPDHQ